MHNRFGLGLDLKGGMNVVLKLNAGDLLRSLANGTEDPNFNKAIELASSAGAEGDFINAFIKEYKQLAPNSKLSVVFGSGALRDQLKANASDDEVLLCFASSMIVLSMLRTMCCVRVLTASVWLLQTCKDLKVRVVSL